MNILRQGPRDAREPPRDREHSDLHLVLCFVSTAAWLQLTPRSKCETIANRNPAAHCAILNGFVAPLIRLSAALFGN